MSKRTFIVVCGAIKKRNKYLVTRRAQEKGESNEFVGKWQFPGGGLEFGEHPEDTLRREIMEETGLEIKTKRLLPYMLSNIRGNRHGIVIIYVCTIKNPKAQVVLNKEATEYKWCTLEEIKHLDGLKGLDNIAEAIKMR